MTGTFSARQLASEDKRERVLRAARQLIPRFGLHNTPMSAIAREAGVAKGTLYLYFESKEALVSSLYRALLQERASSFALDNPSCATPGEAMWISWSGYARWHLESPDAVNLIQQCEASGILTQDALDARLEAVTTGLDLYAAAVANGYLRDLPLAAFSAVFEGSVLALAQLQATGEIEVTDELLRITFECVHRAVVPDPAE